MKELLSRFKLRQDFNSYSSKPQPAYSAPASSSWNDSDDDAGYAGGDANPFSSIKY